MTLMGHKTSVLRSTCYSEKGRRTDGGGPQLTEQLLLRGAVYRM